MLVSFAMRDHFSKPVIPAKAGIHCPNPCEHEVGELDSRFRGNDRTLERASSANDTGAEKPAVGDRRYSNGRSPTYGAQFNAAR